MFRAENNGKILYVKVKSSLHVSFPGISSLPDLPAPGPMMGIKRRR